MSYVYEQFCSKTDELAELPTCSDEPRHSQKLSMTTSWRYDILGGIAVVNIRARLNARALVQKMALPTRPTEVEMAQVEEAVSQLPQVHHFAKFTFTRMSATGETASIGSANDSTITSSSTYRSELTEAGKGQESEQSTAARVDSILSSLDELGILPQALRPHYLKRGPEGPAPTTASTRHLAAFRPSRRQVDPRLHAARVRTGFMNAPDRWVLVQAGYSVDEATRIADEIYDRERAAPRGERVAARDERAARRAGRVAAVRSGGVAGRGGGFTASGVKNSEDRSPLEVYGDIVARERALAMEAEEMESGTGVSDSEH